MYYIIYAFGFRLGLIIRELNNLKKIGTKVFNALKIMRDVLYFHLKFNEIQVRNSILKNVLVWKKSKKMYLLILHMFP